MNRWTAEQASQWYRKQPWLVGCNFIPSTAINQLEMWQAETYDPVTIDRELGWAEQIGFNTVRVFLHDLVWSQDSRGFSKRIDDFLSIADRHGMKVLLTLFDDCHRPDPVLGVQPLPVAGVHNSGWKMSPGQKIVLQFHDGTVAEKEKARLRDYVTGVLTRFADDPRVLLWDLYNESSNGGHHDKSLALLAATWAWAREVRVTQPRSTGLWASSVDKRVHEMMAAESDGITFHSYNNAAVLEREILQYKEQSGGRPLLCMEYMARESGSTFQNCLPVFKEYGIGCYNWGLARAGGTSAPFARLARSTSLRRWHPAWGWLLKSKNFRRPKISTRHVNCPRRCCGDWRRTRSGYTKTQTMPFPAAR